MPVVAAPLDRERGEGRGADVSTDPIGLVVTNRCEVVDGVRVAAEELPRRRDVGAEDRPVRLRLEPEVEARVEEMGEGAFRFGELRLREAAIGPDQLVLDAADRIEEPAHRRAGGGPAPALVTVRARHLGQPARHHREASRHTDTLHEIPSIHSALLLATGG